MSSVLIDEILEDMLTLSSFARLLLIPRAKIIGIIKTMNFFIRCFFAFLSFIKMRMFPKIKKIIPNYIKIIDSGEAVARQTKNILIEKNLLTNEKKGKCIFYTNSDPTVLNSILKGKYSIITKKF